MGRAADPVMSFDRLMGPHDRAAEAAKISLQFLSFFAACLYGSHIFFDKNSLCAPKKTNIALLQYYCIRLIIDCSMS